jgi:hypothetical protein
MVKDVEYFRGKVRAFWDVVSSMMSAGGRWIPILGDETSVAVNGCACFGRKRSKLKVDTRCSFVKRFKHLG